MKFILCFPEKKLPFYSGDSELPLSWFFLPLFPLHLLMVTFSSERDLDSPWGGVGCRPSLCSLCCLYSSVYTAGVAAAPRLRQVSTGSGVCVWAEISALLQAGWCLVSVWLSHPWPRIPNRPPTILSLAAPHQALSDALFVLMALNR